MSGPSAACDCQGVTVRLGPRSRDYLVERYLELGRTSDAMQIRRDDFASAPELAAFGRLRATAKETGHLAWHPAVGV